MELIKIGFLGHHTRASNKSRQTPRSLNDSFYRARSPTVKMNGEPNFSYGSSSIAVEPWSYESVLTTSRCRLHLTSKSWFPLTSIANASWQHGVRHVHMRLAGCFGDLDSRSRGNTFKAVVWFISSPAGLISSFFLFFARSFRSLHAYVDIKCYDIYSFQ